MRTDGNKILIDIGASTQEAKKKIDDLVSTLGKFKRAVSEVSSGSSKSSELKKAFSASFANGIKSATKNALAFNVALVSMPFKKAASGVTDFSKKISQLGAAFKRIVFYRAIRTIIKEIGDAFRVGTQNLYFYSEGIGGKFAKSMDSAATSMMYFKNSIGAAVAPIVNALAPVLDMLVDKIVAVINAINQLFAKLTGATSWTKAIKYPQRYGDSIKKAGKAAKEAKNYLAPFDELNVLQDNKNGGGGTSSLADDYSEMFEEMTTFNSAIADFAEKLKKAIQSGDWTGAGKLLGGKVNDLLNYIDDNNLASKFGHKIGYWINGGIQTAYSFLSTVDFRKIGKIFADGLNGALEEIDFATAGRLFIKSITIWFDTLIGFFGELDWGLVGKSIGDYLRGVFDEASDWLKSVNWSNVARAISDGIYNAVVNFDVKKTARSISVFLQTALKSAGSFVAGIDFGKLAYTIVRAIGDAIAGADVWAIITSLSKTLTVVAVSIIAQIPSIFVDIGAAIVSAVGNMFDAIGLDEIFKGVGIDSISGLLNGISESLINIGNWVREHITDPLVNAVKSWLGIHSPSTVFSDIGGNIVQGLCDGITAKWQKFTSWFQQKWTDLKNWWSKLELPAFKIKKPHLSWTSTPATGWIANVLKTLGLPTSLPKLNVQWYAKGGIIDKASLIGAGEAGKEAIIPLERNTEWISRVAHEMREQASRQNASPFGGDIAGDLEDANGVVVDAIYAAAAQILQGMRENKSGGLDYRAITKEVTRLQKRQAMATGV